MTDLIRRAFEWVRAVLCGPRASDNDSRHAPPQKWPQAPTLYVRGARLVHVPRLPARVATTPPPVRPLPGPRWALPPAAWEYTGALVRPYAAPVGTATRKAQAEAQEAPWAGPWANPWEAAR